MFFKHWSEEKLLDMHDHPLIAWRKIDKVGLGATLGPIPSCTTRDQHGERGDTATITSTLNISLILNNYIIITII